MFTVTVDYTGDKTEHPVEATRFVEEKSFVILLDDTDRQVWAFPAKDVFMIRRASAEG